MKLLISGVAWPGRKALVKSLELKGMKSPPGPTAPDSSSEIEWSPIDTASRSRDWRVRRGPFTLAGESFASSRWDEEKKRKIRESRVKGQNPKRRSRKPGPPS